MRTFKVSIIAVVLILGAILIYREQVRPIAPLLRMDAGTYGDGYQVQVGGEAIILGESWRILEHSNSPAMYLIFRTNSMGEARSNLLSKVDLMILNSIGRSSSNFSSPDPVSFKRN